MTPLPNPDFRAGSTRRTVRAADHRIKHVMFYGTLCRGEANHAALGLSPSLTFLGDRVLPGTLYDLGSYPGLVLGSGSAVGELFRIEDPTLLKRLDQFERYDPRDEAGSLFRRTRVSVPRFRASRSTIEAWVYVYNGDVSLHSRIDTPSWSAYRNREI